MADPIVLPGQNPVIAVQPGQKIIGIRVGSEHVTGGTSKTKTTASMTSTGTYVPPVVVPPIDPPPVQPPATGVPLTYIPTPNTPVPTIGQTITDQFGDKVTCISTNQRHAYPLTNPWNIGTAAESRIMLSFTQVDAQILLGVPPYTLLKTLQVPPYAFWSTTEAHTIYGAQGNALVKIPDTGGPFQKVKDFGVPVTIGNYEGGVSGNGRIALMAGSTMYIWDMVSNSEVSRMPAVNCDGYQISRSGKYMVIRGGNTRVYSADNLSLAPRILDPLANHGACCLIDGVDYYVGNNSTFKKPDGSVVYGVVAFRLSDGQATLLLPPPVAFTYGHVGSYGPRPALSNYDATKTVGQPGNDQIVTVNLDGTVNLFGFAYHLTPDLNDGPTYRRQPHAVSDPSGKRALFMGWDTVCCISERP